ncbi:hypothetical protein V8F06_010645 [Rhypophila decipiens]
MMLTEMAPDKIIQNSASSLRPGTPQHSGRRTENEVDERDITDCTLPQWQWSRSTDELLAPYGSSTPRSSFYSVVTSILDDDGQPRSGCETTGGQYPRLPVPPIRLQLSDRRNDEREAEGRTMYKSSPYPSRNGPRLEMSDHDLELQAIMVPRPPSRTKSTDQLVPKDDPAQRDESSTANPRFLDEQPPAEKAHPANTTGQVPDWKPVSIRWPFQILLLVIMAGLVAFFEYQAHDLPPVQYTMIQLEPPAEGQRLEQGAVNATTTPSQPHVPLSTQPSPGVKASSLPTPTSSSDIPSFAKPKIMVAAPVPAPTPEPDPRPPEDAYPRPPILISTRCGYKKPEWLIYREMFVRNPKMILKQVIPTFFTDDESWCPCYLDLKPWTNTSEVTWSGDWGNGMYVIRTSSTRTEVLITKALAFDKECQTIMSMVSQHNNRYINDFLDGRAGSCYHPNGDGHVMTIMPGSLLLPGGEAITPSLFSTSTMTLTEQPVGVADWEWPKTDAQGNLQLLVDVRDVSSALFRSLVPGDCVFQTYDAFGNTFNVPPYTGFWFASYATTIRPNTLRRDWWTLPFSFTDAASSSSSATNSGPEKVQSLTELPTTAHSTSSTPDILSSSMAMPSVVTDHPKSRSDMAMSSGGTSISGEPLVIVPPSPTTTSLTSTPVETLTGSNSSSSTSVNIIASLRLSSTAFLMSTKQSPTLRTSSTSSKLAQGEQSMTSEALVNGTSSSEKTTAVNPSRTITISGEHTDMSAVASPTAANSNTTKSRTTPMTIHHSPNITVTLGRPLEGESHDDIITSSTNSIPQFTLQASKTNTSADFSSSSSLMGVIPGIQTRIQPDPTSPSQAQATIPDPILANNTTATTADTPQLTEIPKGPIPPGAGSNFANLRSETDFFMASLAPVILATILSIAIQIFTSSISSMLPFRTLGNDSSDGAKSEDSLTLSRNTGIWGLTGFRLLSRHRDALCLINILIGLLAAALVPVSSEVIRLEFSQYCGTDKEMRDFYAVPEVLPGHSMVCAYGLRNSGPTMRLAEGIVGLMALMLCGMGYMIFRWRTGVGTEPWSIASMAALLVSSDHRIRHALLSMDPPPNSRGEGFGKYSAEIRQAFHGKGFRIGWFNPQPEASRPPATVTTPTQYGIYMVDESPCQDRASIRITTRDPRPQPASKTNNQTSPGRASRTPWLRHITVPPEHKETVILSTVLFLTTALLVLILYYESTIFPETKFEAFMNGQTFGVRILFTSLGTAATWFWDYYFSYTSSQAIYTRLFNHSQGHSDGEPARSSILLSPPTNVFLGIYQFFVLLVTSNTTTARENRRGRLGKILHSLSIAIVALLAKFTPILFANIPFRDTVTFRMHEVCTWLAVSVLSCMVLVLGVSIWVNVRHEKISLPVMPDTIVGGMYYVAGAAMLRDFEGMDLYGVGGKGRKWERDKMVSAMGRRYGFGEMERQEVQGQSQQYLNKGLKGERRKGRRLRVDYIELLKR